MIKLIMITTMRINVTDDEDDNVGYYHEYYYDNRDINDG